MMKNKKHKKPKKVFFNNDQRLNGSEISIGEQQAQDLAVQRGGKYFIDE